MALEKIEITPLDAQFNALRNPIKVMYNPKEFTVETRNQFQRTAIPGLPTPITQFVSGETQKLTLELFFDTYDDDKIEKEDVRIKTAEVLELTKINSKLHAPPVCEFSWGGRPLFGDFVGSGSDTNSKKMKFYGVIDSITQKFTMFLETGIPVRATLSISVSEYQTIEAQLNELGLKSADHTKHIVFKQGDSLWSLANDEYGNPNFWRTIAEANNIDNPRLIKPGTELSFPPLE